MSAATWEEVKRKAAEKRASDAPPPEPEPETLIEEPTVSSFRIVEEAPIGFVADRPAPRRRRASLFRRLDKGRDDEVRFRTEGIPEGLRPKFVKVYASVHVQTRGPVVLIKSEAVDEHKTWSIWKLLGDYRFPWGEPYGLVVQRLAEEGELIGGPWDRISTVKEQARTLIRAANGELGS